MSDTTPERRCCFCGGADFEISGDTPAHNGDDVCIQSLSTRLADTQARLAVVEGKREPVPDPAADIFDDSPLPRHPIVEAFYKRHGEGCDCTIDDFFHYLLKRGVIVADPVPAAVPPEIRSINDALEAAGFTAVEGLAELIARREAGLREELAGFKLATAAWENKLATRTYSAAEIHAMDRSEVEQVFFRLQAHHSSCAPALAVCATNRERAEAQLAARAPEESPEELVEQWWHSTPSPVPDTIPTVLKEIALTGARKFARWDAKRRAERGGGKQG